MQTAPLTLDTMPSPEAAPAPRGRLRALLIIVAVCHAASGLWMWPIYFGNLSDAVPGVAGWLTAVNIAINPLLAIAALVLALRGRLRFAIMAIAALSLFDWSRSLPKIIDRGGDFIDNWLVYPTSPPVLYDLAQFYLLPVLCVAAIVLAAVNVRLGLATVLATAQSVLNGLLWLAFVVAVSIYGF